MGRLTSNQVSVDIHHWPQGGLEFPKPERREEKQNAALLICPRCESTNAKFCYFNNYSRSQPRHFCRACRRHWTEGGSLRNIPVGGGRKNKRRKISPTATSFAAAAAGNPIATVDGEMKDPIFPDILRQVLLSQPPLPMESPSMDTMEGLFGASLPKNSLTFMEDFMGADSIWVKKEAVFPASYWDFWDGGAEDLNIGGVAETLLPE